MKIPFPKVFADETKSGTKLKTCDYQISGSYPIIDQGQDFIAGYTDSVSGLYTDVPAIVFGDHTRALKYVDFPFFLGADGAKILKARSKQANYKYLYYALKSVRIPDTGYNRHFKWLKETTVSIPESQKQETIVLTLDSIARIISRRKSQLAKLDELVKCRFVEMFGEPVANPMGWATKSMHEVAPHSPIEIKTKSNDIWLLNLDKIESHTGRVTEYVYVQPDEIGTSTCGFDNRHVLYSKLRPYLNKVVVPNKSGMATSELLALLPNEELNREFLAHLLRSDNFVGYISEKVSGAKMPRVSMDIFRAFPCIVPPMPLQNAFDTFVRRVDKLRFVKSDYRLICEGFR